QDVPNRRAASDALLDQQPVDHDFDCMVASLVEFDVFVKLSDLAVDSNTIEAGPRKFLDFLFEFALPASHDGREDHHPFAFGESGHLLDDLIDRLARCRADTS